MLLDNLMVSKKFPIMSDFEKESEKRKFCQISFRSNGSEYINGVDDERNAIVIKFPCEEETDYRLRKQQTPTRSFVSSILYRYNSAVFKNEPVRDSSSNILSNLLQNSDGYNTSLNNLMKKALLKAQIDKVSYLMVGKLDQSQEVISQAQAQQAQFPYYIKIVEADSVVYLKKVEGSIVEIVIDMVNEEGKRVFRYFNDSIYVDIEVGKGDVILGIGPQIPHGFNRIPITAVEPFAEQSQALPIAYAQKSIVNTLSLLKQEERDNVFTRYVFSGVSDAGEQDNQKITWGSKRIVTMRDSSVNIHKISSEQSQSEILRKNIQDDMDNMYESAGFGKGNQEPSNLSGYALNILKAEFFSFCDTLKQAIENAENYILETIAEVEGEEIALSVYSTRYIADDTGAELLALRDTLAIPDIPPTFRKLLIKNYINTYFNVDAENMARIEQELDGSV